MSGGGRNRLLSPAEAAAFLGLSPATLETDRCRGSLGVPFVKVSRRVVRYRMEDLESWVNARWVSNGSGK